MLPSLIIIGAAKCGTTSLHYYLGQHPEICMSRPKEPSFFVTEHNWDRGLEWYESHFTDASASVLGESSTTYTSYPTHRGVPERMSSLVPEAKLIYLVGDPIERVVSQYVGAYRSGSERRTLSDALTASVRGRSDRYINRSRYYIQLEQYLQYFRREQILLLSQDDLLRERRATLGEVFRFLGVGGSFDSPHFDGLRNTSSGKRRRRGLPRRLSRYENALPGRDLPSWARKPVRWMVSSWPLSTPVQRPRLDDDLRAALARQLKPDADRLRRFTGRAFEEWSV